MSRLCESLNAAAPVWLERMWVVFWQSTILVAVVALLSVLLLRRSSPAIRYWVWQILALKLLVMPFWTYSVPLPKFVPQTIADVAVVSVPPANVAEDPSETVRATVDGQTPATAATRDTAGELGPNISTRLSWQAWLLVAWGGIVLGQVIRLGLQRRRLLRFLRNA